LHDLASSNVKYTQGNISDLAGLRNNPAEIQHTAAIQPGNSGGPMALMDGRIAGIIVSTLSPSFALRNTGSLPQGVNFSVKTDNLMEMGARVGVQFNVSKSMSHDPVEHVKAYTVQVEVDK
jgi:S1-C subfamily serine protease